MFQRRRSSLPANPRKQSTNSLLRLAAPCVKFHGERLEQSSRPMAMQNSGYSIVSPVTVAVVWEQRWTRLCQRRKRKTVP